MTRLVGAVAYYSLLTADVRSSDDVTAPKGKRTGLIPLYSNQTGGGVLNGAQFPKVFPAADMVESDW